jgi:hypothetical protein
MEASSNITFSGDFLPYHKPETFLNWKLKDFDKNVLLRFISVLYMQIPPTFYLPNSLREGQSMICGMVLWV